MGRDSNWSRQHKSDEDFSRAAWDSLVDTEKTEDVWVAVGLTPGIQRGVFILKMQAESRRPGEVGRVVASYQTSYPNGRAQALSSFLFACANTLSQQVSSARLEEYKALFSTDGPQS